MVASWVVPWIVEQGFVEIDRNWVICVLFHFDDGFVGLANGICCVGHGFEASNSCPHTT